MLDSKDCTTTQSLPVDGQMHSMRTPTRQPFLAHLQSSTACFSNALISLLSPWNVLRDSVFVPRIEEEFINVNALGENNVISENSCVRNFSKHHDTCHDDSLSILFKKITFRDDSLDETPPKEEEEGSGYEEVDEAEVFFSPTNPSSIIKESPNDSSLYSAESSYKTPTKEKLAISDVEVGINSTSNYSVTRCLELGSSSQQQMDTPTPTIINYSEAPRQNNISYNMECDLSPNSSHSHIKSESDNEMLISNSMEIVNEDKSARSSVPSRRGTIILKKPLFLRNIEHSTYSPTKVSDVSSVDGTLSEEKNAGVLVSQSTLQSFSKSLLREDKENLPPRNCNISSINGDLSSSEHNSAISNSEEVKQLNYRESCRMSFDSDQIVGDKLSESQKTKLNERSGSLGNQSVTASAPNDPFKIEELRLELFTLKKEADEIRNVTAKYMLSFEEARDLQSAQFLALSIASEQAKSELNSTRREAQTVHKALLDLNGRLARTKEKISEKKAAEVERIKKIEQLREKISLKTEKVHKYRDYYTEKMGLSLSALNSEKTSGEHNLDQLRVQVKQLDLKISSLQAQLHQKTQENQELTHICDGLLANS